GDARTCLGEAPLPLGGAYDLAFAPDGRLLAAGCEEGVVVWDVPASLPANGPLVRRWFFRAGNVHSVAIHPSGLFLASGGLRIELWSLTSHRLLASFAAPEGAARVSFSADGRLLLALGPSGRALWGWHVTDTPEKLHLLGHRAGVPGLAFSPDGLLLAS